MKRELGEFDDVYFCTKCGHNHYCIDKEDGEKLNWSIYWKHLEYKKEE